MNYRCKFCGYRFKDRDEQVCPECFTAREDDISCGVLGEDEHSHGFYDERYGSSSAFAKNDTFRDGSADFLRNERRSENRTQASHYERRNGGDINVAAEPRRQYQNVQYNNPQMNRMPNPNGLQPQSVKKNNGCGTGCLVVVIIFIIISVFGGIIADLLDGLDLSENTAVSDNSDVEILTPDDEGDPGSIDCFLSSSERNEFDSGSDGMTIFQKQNLTLAENGELMAANKAAPRQVYKYDCVISFMYMNDGSKVSSDDLEITGVICDAITPDGGIISSYECMSYECMLYNIGDSSEIRPTIFCDAEADELIIIVETIYKGEPMNYQLNVDVQ